MAARRRTAPVEVGGIHGELTVLAEGARDNRHRGYRTWVVSCSCGVQNVVRDGDLRSGGVRSCGCSRRRPRADARPVEPVASRPAPSAPASPPPSPGRSSPSPRPASSPTVASADKDGPLSIRLALTPEEAALLRAVALVDGGEVGDPAGVLVRLLHAEAKRRALHLIVGQTDPRLRATVTSAAEKKKRLSAAAQRNGRRSPAEWAARRAGAIEAGHG